MSKKYYPSIKNAVVNCILFTVLSILFGVIAGIIIIATSSFKEAGIIMNTSIILATLLEYFVLFKIILKRVEIRKPELFNLNYLTPKMLVSFSIMMSGFIFFTFQISVFINTIIPKPQFIKDVFSYTSNTDYFTNIMLVLVIPVVFEEILFRGFILKGLIRNYSPKTAIVISSLLFGLIHLNPWQFAPAFLLGLIFAYITLKTKSIIYPMIGHFIYNLITILVRRFPNLSFFKLFIGEDGNIPPEINLIAIVLFLAGLYLISNNLKNEPLKPLEEPQVDDITA